MSNYVSDSYPMSCILTGMEDSKINEKDLEIARLEGYLECLFDYAWWKNGKLYIGPGIKTYEEEKKLVESLLNKLKNEEDK